LSHFKSRRGSCSENKEVSIVQGDCYSVRLRSSQLITDYLKDDEGTIMLLGDLNAYSQESAILWFESNGYENAKYTKAYKQKEVYSYGYDGMLGNLDHALLNAKAKERVLSILDWHINSEAPSLFELRVNQNETSNNILRNSDHDLILIELRSNLSD